jgi:hypothetical protein
MTSGEEFVLSLGLDISKFTENQRKAVDSFNKTSDDLEKRLKRLEETNKNVGYSFGNASSAALGFIEVLAGAGMAAFAKDTMNYATGLGKVATNAGESVQEMSALTRMIERNGGSADAAAGSIKGLADAMQALRTGRAGDDFLMGFTRLQQTSPNLNASSTPQDLIFALAKYRDTHSAQEVNQTGQMIGMGQDLIDEAMRGSTQVLKDYKEAWDGAMSPAQQEKLAKGQRGLSGLWLTIKMLGADVVTWISEPFAKAADSVTSFANSNRVLADSLFAVGAALGILKGPGLALKGIKSIIRAVGSGGASVAGEAAGAAATEASLGTAVASNLRRGGTVGAALSVAGIMKYDSQHGNSLRTWLRAQLGIEDPGEAAPWAGALPSDATSATPTPAGGAFRSRAEKEAFIRATAVIGGRRPIDPDVAMAVARAEGFDNFKSTIPGEQSFGAFQLHVTPGGRGHAVGDEFKRQTGLDPADPANERRGIQFALDWVRQHGWHDFHGAANTGIGNRQGIGDIHIENMTVTTQATNGAQFAKEVRSSLDNRVRSTRIANNANSGMQ